MGTRPADSFIWAVATAAYQIEGGFEDDGRGRSLWDAIRREEGRIKDGSHHSLSVEGRYKWKEDVQLIKDLGVSHYRFSVDWCRVMHDERTRNTEGMNYYKQLCKELHLHGIKCIVTLFHADIPLRLYEEGSFLREGIVQDFTNFARYCFEELGEWVSHWFTFNEPRMHVWSGIVKVHGEPYHNLNLDYQKFVGNIPLENALLIATRHILLSHASVYHLFHDEFHHLHGKVGIILGGPLCTTLSSDEDSKEELIKRVMGCLFFLFIHPLLSKETDWPLEAKSFFGDRLPVFTMQDKQALKGSVDVIGLNYYCPMVIQDGSGPSFAEQLLHFKIIEEDGYERISGPSSWLRFCPEGLVLFIETIQSRYGQVPILITENGCADLPGQSTLDDDHRIRYIEGHLRAVGEARGRGAVVEGYTAWSLLDNLEWDDGFEVRFGLHKVHLNSKDKRREPKKSAGFYRHTVSSLPQGPLPDSFLPIPLPRPVTSLPSH